MYEQFSSKASGTTVKNLNIDMVRLQISVLSFEKKNLWQSWIIYLK